MKRFLTITILMSMMILFIGSTVNAQRHMGRGHGDFGKRDEHMKNLENLRLLKLLETLDLNDEQNDKFIGAYSQFRKKSRELRDEVEIEVDNLIQYLNEENKADDVILEKVDKIVDKKEEFENIRKQFFDTVKGILSAEQLGRMMVFQERFEREMLEQVRGFRAPKSPDAPDPMPNPDMVPDFPGDNN